MTVQELLEANSIKLESTARGRHYTTCPQCSAKRSREHQNSKCLGVTIDGKGARWGCNHCGWTGPEKGGGGSASGEQPKEQTYDYLDADGNLLFQKVRNQPGSNARFYCRQADGNGRWMNNLKGIDHKPLYRWPEILAAMKQGEMIAIAEGEKDCDNLWRIGIPSSCNFDGAADITKNAKTKPKWKREYSEQLAGADLVVFNDNDMQGYAHADAVCRMSVGLAKRVRRLDLAPHWLGMPKGADVSDWLTQGHTREELDALIAAAPDYAAPTTPEPESDPHAADAEITRLAKLSPLEYEQQRKAAAEKLDVRASILDRLVRDERARLGLDGDDGKQGHAIAFAESEPWPRPINGAELLDSIAAAIRRHVVLPDHARDACALWVTHTYLLDRLMITPRLGIRSPVKGCGKTTLLDVTAQLAYRPLSAANISASAVFRVIEGHRPCLLIDEADAFLPEAEELRGVLNSGHRRGGAVLRNVGDDHEPRAFSTFAACAIALIGQLPGTLADRSVTVDLTRRKADESVEAFRFDRVGHLAELARKLVRWTGDNAEAIAATEPVMPAGLYNRMADNWRPLLAIATVAGGDWLSRGHTAALQGAGADVEEASRLELLLGDIRDIFEALAAEPSTTDKDRISSAHLIERLVEIVPRPWAEFGRGGKPITQNKLARLLKPLGIRSEKIGPEKTRVNGYIREHFEEAFGRYLPPKGDFKPDSRTERDEMGTSAIFKPDSFTSAVRLRNAEKPSNDGLLSTCPVGERGNGKAGPVCTYCGRPGGNRLAYGDGEEVRLHRECEDPWIECRMGEEGIRQ